MKGYIVKKDGKWYIVQMMNYVGYEPHWSTAVEIHPSHLTGIEQYEGKEVEYEVKDFYIAPLEDVHNNMGENVTYAIPIPSDDNEDVWGEALQLIKDKFVPVAESRRFAENIITLLKQHYELKPLTKTNP